MNAMIQFENAVKRFGDIILTELKESGIKAWVAGGAVRDYFMGINIETDFDLFFPNEDEYKKAESLFKNKQAKVLRENENGMKVRHNNRTFDLVKKYFENPEKTIEAFDFTVSMFAVDNEKVYHGETSFIDLSKRQLMINKITYPASTLYRAFRYYKKGFTMCQGEMVKIVEAIQSMPKAENKEDTDQTELSGDKTTEIFIGID